jgi:hypothetical protein
MVFPQLVQAYRKVRTQLETWVLFVDFVKAFDTVPLDGLFAVLRLYGLPNHFVNIVNRLHKNAMIKLKIGSVDSESRALLVFDKVRAKVPSDFSS